MSERDEDRRGFERWLARGFTIFGGLFWIATAFAGPYVFGGKSFLGAFSIAVFPFIFTVGVLAIGWFYERFTALILALGAIGTVVWGVIMGWEMSVWMIMVAFFVAPTIVAAVLFYLAGEDDGDPAAEMLVRANRRTETSSAPRQNAPATDPVSEA